MKQKTNILARFKQWILSIVKHRYHEPITSEYLISWCMECGKRFDKPVKILQGEHLICIECAEKMHKRLFNGA